MNPIGIMFAELARVNGSANDTGGLAYSALLSHLEPDVVYNLTVYSTNNNGASDQANHLSFMTYG